MPPPRAHTFLRLVLALAAAAAFAGCPSSTPPGKGDEDVGAASPDARAGMDCGDDRDASVDMDVARRDVTDAPVVPATMRLLGDWNWWAPPFIQRIQRRLIRGGH